MNVTGRINLQRLMQTQSEQDTLQGNHLTNLRQLVVAQKSRFTIYSVLLSVHLGIGMGTGTIAYTNRKISTQSRSVINELAYQ